jgi:hypothetical protein
VIALAAIAAFWLIFIAAVKFAVIPLIDRPEDPEDTATVAWIDGLRDPAPVEAIELQQQSGPGTPTFERPPGPTGSRLLAAGQRAAAEAEATSPWADDVGTFTAIAAGWGL